MLAITVACLTFSGSKDYAGLFAGYKKNFSKAYESPAHEAKAFAAFSAAEDAITTHNSKASSFKLGHNAHSDKVWEEFFQGGYIPRSKRNHTAAKLHQARPLSQVATSVDWVTSGAVTGVKNQGQCGSCWSFSTTGAIEGAYYIASGTLTSFSEEMLVECDTTDSGCNGGSMDNAFTWVETHGLATESSYPYTSSSGTSGTCDSTANPVVTVTGYTDVSSEDDLQSAVAQQPVSVAIEADQSVFQYYTSGVIDSTSCGTTLDHGVLVVGYGTDSTYGAYWKVKNSWGTTWGEEGYVRIAKGSNMCGIAMDPSYPTGAQAWSA